MYASARKHSMNRSALSCSFFRGSKRLLILSASVVEASQHNEGFSHLHLRIDNSVIPVLAKSGHIIAPQMASWDDSRGAISLGGVARWNK